MAKVKGITIELSADASGIESALKSVNKELNSTQAQLKSVDKSLKLNPESVQLLAQKQQLLTKAVDETTKKLEALKAAQEDVANSGGKAGDTQYDALTREISDTEQSLKKLKKVPFKSIYADSTIFFYGNGHTVFHIIQEFLAQGIHHRHLRLRQPNGCQNRAGSRQGVNGTRKQHTSRLTPHSAGTVNYHTAGG